MECLPGRTLADELAEAPIAPHGVRAIAMAIAGALETAHRVGIVHRDVKPGNILIPEDGHAKLADFGIAKSTEALDHTMNGMIVGTPAYLAPERLGGEPATPHSLLGPTRMASDPRPRRVCQLIGRGSGVNVGRPHHDLGSSVRPARCGDVTR